MSGNNQQNLWPTNPMNVYFNQKEETFLFLSGKHYYKTLTAVPSKPNQQQQRQRLTFWSFNGYHRVFGLYIERFGIRETRGPFKGQFSYCLCVYYMSYQSSKSKIHDWHHYANYWPQQRVYINNLYTNYYDTDLKTPIRKNKASEQLFSWYQSITSMLLIGAVNGSPDLLSKLDKLAKKIKPPPSLSDIYKEKNISVNKYFWLLAGRQLGVHVFIRDNGLLNAILVFVGRHGNKWLIDMFPSAKIHGHYPTIRNERDLKKPKQYIMNRQVFTMGLLFKRFNSDHKNVCWLENHGSYSKSGVEILKPLSGWPVDEYRKSSTNPTDDRVYNRLSDITKPLSVAGVYDLTEELYRNHCYDDRKNERQKPAAPYCFALYMCAGAKLLVRDSYNFDPETEKHNQTLVEQGGVVVVEDQLEVSLMIYDDNNNDITIKWEDFCNNHMKTNKWIKEKIKKYKNPVLFLGANESDYNTIAWRLVIDKRGFEKRRGSNPEILRCKRRSILGIPEGAYIVAIEEWEPGVEEIWQRHRYEQLHRAIVRHSQDIPYLYRGYEPQSFSVPIFEFLTKILKNQDNDNENNIFIDRDIEIDIHQSVEIIEAYNTYYAEKERREKDKNLVFPNKVYPKEFNFYRFNSIDSNTQQSNCPPPTPPAYPPVKISNPENPNQFRLFYLPQVLSIDDNNKCDLRTVFKKYSYDPMTYKTLSDQNIYPFGKQQNLPILKLSDDTSFTFNEHQWEAIDNPCDYKHLLENRMNFRLGVDGRYYRKIIDKQIGSVYSRYYEFVYPNDPNKQVVIQPNTAKIIGQPLVGKRSDAELKTLIANNELLGKPNLI